MSSSIHPAESSSDVEWLSRDSCNSFCEQRLDQFRRDAEALELVRDELMRAQKETIVRGLCTLNKDVKQLTVREFNATFGCDVIDMIREQMAAGDVRSSAGKKRFRALNLKTPAAAKMSKPPMTIRTVRRGEVVKSFSVNGSPVEQFDHGEVFLTAKKRRGVEGNGKVSRDNNYATFPVSIGIGVGNGETVDLSDPNQRKNLNREQREDAMQQLMAIQEQMNKLMADF